VPAPPVPLGLTERRHVLVAPHDPARVGAFDRSKDSQQRALARARGPGDPDDLAGRDSEVRQRERDERRSARRLAERQGHVPDFEGEAHVLWARD
jgi:hypothetical protein